MAKNYGVGVSGWLDPEGRNWETGVYQASKPVLDKELNLVQDNAQYQKRRRSGIPSGWLSPGIVDSSDATAEIFTASTTANEYEFPSLEAIVNDWQILVRYTGNATTSNIIDLGAPPAGVGAKRTDLVFLEVWRRLISASPDTVGKSAAGRIWRNGNVKIAGADDLTLNLADDILDGSVGAETTKRVQIQYRIRVHQNVNTGAFPQGLDDPTVVANTVPASAAAPNGTPTAYAFANQSANGDPGLWIAGDGNPANGLGTVDGYVYAIPLTVVFRRNTSAFDRDLNHNGGVAAPGPSDRPDGLFYDIVDVRDVMDIRRCVSRSGWNYPELLSKNVNYMFDNALQTEIETTSLGGGSVGHTNIWADEIGPVDNAGAVLIRNFDSVARQFSDRVIYETTWLKFTPADQNGGGPTWTTGDYITIDPSALPIYPYHLTPVNLSSGAPNGVMFAAPGRLLRYGGSVNGYVWDTWAGIVAPTGFGISPAAAFSAYIGSTHNGNDYDLYLQVIIGYPAGSGLTKTPTGDYGLASFVNEVPANLPAAAPHEYQAMEVQSFDYAHREVEITYRTNSVTWDMNYFNGSGPFKILGVPEQIINLISITEPTAGTYTGTSTIDGSRNLITISNQASDWSNAVLPASSDTITITYEAERPIPQNNCQFTIWYEARAPQTISSALLGTTLQVTPRYFCPHLHTLICGSGSSGEAYPFPYQYVQSPGVYATSGGPVFGGDHEMDGSPEVVLANFSVDTGFIQVPTLIPAVPNPQSLFLVRDPGDIDAEGRSFFKEIPAGYVPAAFGQSLSNAKRHKNCLAVICELTEDGSVGTKGTLLLVVFSRWAPFDANNKIAFDADLASNYTTASVYRLKGNPLDNRK